MHQRIGLIKKLCTTKILFNNKSKKTRISLSNDKTVTEPESQVPRQLSLF